MPFGVALSFFTEAENETDKSNIRSALAHRDYAWLASSFVVSNIGSWAYNVALIVWVFDRTESTAWVAAATMARFVPSLLFSAYGGVLAERFERRSLIALLNLTFAATHVLLGFVVLANGPVIVALALAGASTMQGTIYEPAVVALTPQIVGEKDLAAANSLNGIIDNAAVVIGPAIGAILLAIFSPGVAILVNAATFVYAGYAASKVKTRSSPSDVTEGGRGPLAQMAVGIKAFAESTYARVLGGMSIAASFIYGVDTVQLIVLSDERLGTGSTGYGYLLTAVGVGGLLAAPTINRLAAMPRLGSIIALAMAAYTIPTAILVFTDSPAVAFVIEVIRGAGTLIVDVMAITAMQRTLAPELISRVYGVFIALVLGAISLGALVAAPLINTLGLDASLVVMGIGPVVLTLGAMPALRQIDHIGARQLEGLQPVIELLLRSPLFAALSRPGLEQLANTSTRISVSAGEDLVAQGEKANALYVIVDGGVKVTAHEPGTGERHIADLDAGDYFGEIGLLENAPRNATCTAVTDGSMLRIDGEAFLAAVHEAPHAGFLERAKQREAQTHHRLVSLAAIEDGRDS